MTPDPAIQEELRSLRSPLADGPSTMPYAVPQGYFDGLPARTAAIAADAPPEGYFEALPGRLLARLTEEGGASAGTTPVRKTRRIALPPVRLWAAAAVLILSIGTGGVIMLRGGAGSAAADPLASIPDDAIEAWAATEGSPALPYTGSTDEAGPSADPLAGIPADAIEAYLQESLYLD